MEEIDEQARKMRLMAQFALTWLLEQAGGSVTITQAQYEAVLARYGGSAMMALHLEWVTLGNGEQAVRAMLIRKPPHQGELPA